MKSFLTLLLLLTITIFLVNCQDHECVHDELDFDPTPEDLFEDSDQPEIDFLTAPANYQPIRIHMDYSRNKFT